MTEREPIVPGEFDVEHEVPGSMKRPPRRPDAPRFSLHTLVTSPRAPNPAFWWVISGTLGFLALVLYLPGLREVFGCTYLHRNDVLRALVAGATGIAWFELFKRAKGTPG